MSVSDNNPKTIEQLENSRRKLLRKLVATARDIISNDVGIPVGAWKIRRLLNWLEQQNVVLNFQVFEEYWNAISAIPSGKERLNCSREALRSYDSQLNPITLSFFDRIMDACFEIIKTHSISN